MEHINKDITPKLIEKVTYDRMRKKKQNKKKNMNKYVLLLNLQKFSVVEQEKIDKFMLELDGTENKCECLFVCCLNCPISTFFFFFYLRSECLSLCSCS